MTTGGTLTLTATNAYSGGTTITAGTLQIGNGGTTGSITGNVADNGALAFDRSDSVTFSGVVSGAGSLADEGTGALTLTGANTYTGGTTIAAGATLQIGDGTTGSIAGGVVDNGALVFNTPLEEAVVVTGSGALVQNGPGAVTLGAGGGRQARSRSTTARWRRPATASSPVRPTSRSTAASWRSAPRPRPSTSPTTTGGELTLSGGTLNVAIAAPNTAVDNEGTISGSGTIDAANGGAIANNGEIDVAASATLTFTSVPATTLENDGEINLGGGTLALAGGVTLDNTTGLVTEAGTIRGAFVNSGGELLVDTGQTITVTSAFASGGLILLNSASSWLKGGAIANSGAIEGVGGSATP